jgi:hypothetical protein
MPNVEGLWRVVDWLKAAETGRELERRCLELRAQGVKLAMSVHRGKADLAMRNIPSLVPASSASSSPRRSGSSSIRRSFTAVAASTIGDQYEADNLLCRAALFGSRGAGFHSNRRAYGGAGTTAGPTEQ